jgi:hypothetical protein
MMSPQQSNRITLLAIISSVRRKTGILASSPNQLVELIKSNHLEDCVFGEHNGEQITHAKAFEIVTGAKLRARLE